MYQGQYSVNLKSTAIKYGEQRSNYVSQGANSMDSNLRILIFTKPIFCMDLKDRIESQFRATSAAAWGYKWSTLFLEKMNTGI
jgi:hypothetical protein